MKHPDAERRLGLYEGLVREWADRLDLVSPGDLERFSERHVADSLKALGVVSSAPPGPAIDVGSGAGLPGIVLAIADPTRSWTLLEPRVRRAAFLEEAVRRLDLTNCRVAVMRAEDVAADPDFHGRHAVAIARALAPPHQAFELLLPLVSAGGCAAVFVSDRQEIPAYAEMTDDGLAIVRRRPKIEEKPGRR